MIEGVEIYPLRVIPDGRGRILHFMRKTDPFFKDFDVQEVYFSIIYPGAIKAWHRHTKMTLNYVVPIGNIKLVLFQQLTRTEGNIQEIYLGENCSHQLIRIPPMIWNGFTTVDGKTAVVANVTDLVHNPNEIEREHPWAFSYEWETSKYG